MKPEKPGQQDIRQDLTEIVETHFTSVWQRPIAAHSAAAFDAVREQVEASSLPLIIDSCCGTGDGRLLVNGEDQGLCDGDGPLEEGTVRGRG